MSNITALWGYIEIRPGQEEAALSILGTYPFEEPWPFPNIYCYPEPGPRRRLIAFALKMNHLSEDWLDWRGRFEHLLGSLPAREAEIMLDTEIPSDVLPSVLRVTYVPKLPDDPPSQEGNEWWRFSESQEYQSIPVTQKEAIVIPP